MWVVARWWRVGGGCGGGGGGGGGGGAVGVAVAAGWSRRGLGLVAVLAVGAVVGVVPWLVEAYARFGGPVARLRLSSAVEGHLGWHVAAGMELRALNGPVLCRP